MRILILLSVLFVAGGCTSNSKMDRVPAQKNEEPTFPNPEALKSWKNEIPMTRDLNWKVREQVEWKCDSQDLLPTHPQQNSKIYHQIQKAQYDASKLRAEDEPCLIGSKFAGKEGKKSCLKATLAQQVVLSDLYENTCGQVFRAVWKESFLEKNETMGTLFSKGRTLYPTANKANDPGEMVIGDTYAVPRKDFIYLMKPFPEDEMKIKEGRLEAKKMGFDQDPKTFIFKMKKN